MTTTGAGNRAVEDAKRRLSRRRISTKATSARSAKQQEAEIAAGYPHKQIRYLAKNFGNASRARTTSARIFGTSIWSKSRVNRNRDNIREESFGETEIFYTTIQAFQSKLTFFSC